MKRYVFDADGVCEIPELEMHFQFTAIDPKRESKYGAWPYSLSYQVPGLDAFGLAHFGSSIRIEDPAKAESVLNEFIQRESKAAKDVIEIARLGSREMQVGHKYKVEFVSPGLIHKGTYFESYRDIERYFGRMSKYGDPNTYEARVSHASTRAYLGKYVVSCGAIIFEEGPCSKALRK